MSAAVKRSEAAVKRSEEGRPMRASPARRVSCDPAFCPKSAKSKGNSRSVTRT